ncbi:MAG: hypothetical protein ABIX01_15150 [Chitinophagaceae bacterium]
MKWIVSILLIVVAASASGREGQSRFFIDNFWNGFHYYHEKKIQERLQASILMPSKNIFLYGGETSVLQQKLLLHEVGVPQFFKPSEDDGDDVGQYLKWIIFSKQDPKKLFPDIIRRPLGYVPNFITESFYRFGITVPIN